jgi:hypothetical protein
MYPWWGDMQPLVAACFQKVARGMYQPLGGATL